MTGYRLARPEERLQDWLPQVGDHAFSLLCSDATPDLCVVSAQDHVHSYPAHLHDCVELIWVHSGRGRITCRESTYRVRAGDVCLIAPNELHSTSIPASGRCTFTILHLPSRLYWQVFDGARSTGHQPQPFRILRYHALDQSIVALLEAFAGADDDDSRCELLSTLLEDALSAPHSFASVRAEKSFRHPAVVHARQLMAERRAEPVRLEEIAAEVGLNMRYFISLFREETGLPPHQYQMALRVETARQLMQMSDMNLSEIALNAGFSDQSHFSRLFKRCYGFTPGLFRQHLQVI